MSVHVQPLSTLAQLRGLLEVSRRVRDESDLTRLVDRIAETISESLGFATVAINLYRPAEGDYVVTTVHGSAGAREALVGKTRRAETWDPFLSDRFYRRGAYFIPHESIDWERMPSYVPDLPVVDDPEAWHPEDALVVPMRGSDGSLLGVLSVDEPEAGLRPGDEELDVLVAFAEHVGAAIEAANDAATAARDRAALSRLLEVSASLVELDSVGAVLDGVARGIHDALDFENVAVCVAVEDGFAPVGLAGFDPDDPALRFRISQADLDRLFVPEFEIEGCYLIENEAARALVPSASSHVSTRNAGGPNAWSRHWLLVPLVERDGSRRGFVWADDPADSMLPSRERLQALRTFANQATMAIRAAADFELLSARNSELAALHDTAFGLLERLELDQVLSAIVENASRLVDSPNAYLYLADPKTGALRLRVGLGVFEADLGREVQPGKGVSGKVVLSGRTEVVDGYSVWPDRLTDYDERGFHGVVGVPLRAGGELAGVIGIARFEPRPFDAAQVALLERFASLASLALENANLYAALGHSEELHRGIVEHSAEIISLVDLEGRVVVVSPSTMRALGVDAEGILGHHFADFVHPEDLETAAEMYRNAVAGEIATAKLRALHSDGSVVLLEATANAVAAPDGGPQHVLATARDVTERHQLEEQLRQAQKMESIGRLAGGVAHDFNNLLTAIRGYAELLLYDLEDDNPARESAAEIARAAERAASLTGQLLAFSRKQVLRPQRLDLNEVVAGMSSMLSRVLGEDVVLMTALEPGLRPTLADPTQLEQVLLNLAVNARDAMPAGGNLVVRTANVEAEDGPHVALVVADTGTGMDPETATRIFEPFFTTKDVGAGTGLGLATVHGIVAQSGGSVSVASEPGLGTTFTVSLPAAP